MVNYIISFIKILDTSVYYYDCTAFNEDKPPTSTLIPKSGEYESR